MDEGIILGHIARSLLSLKTLLLCQMRYLQLHNSMESRTPCGQKPMNKTSWFSMVGKVIYLVKFNTQELSDRRYSANSTDTILLESRYVPEDRCYRKPLRRV